MKLNPAPEKIVRSNFMGELQDINGDPLGSLFKLPGVGYEIYVTDKNPGYIGVYPQIFKGSDFKLHKSYRVSASQTVKVYRYQGVLDLS